jgi:hypothetical protein
MTTITTVGAMGAVDMHQVVIQLSKRTRLLPVLVLSVAVTEKNSKKLERTMRRPTKRLMGLTEHTFIPHTGAVVNCDIYDRG